MQCRNCVYFEKFEGKPRGVCLIQDMVTVVKEESECKDDFTKMYATERSSKNGKSNNTGRND